VARAARQDVVACPAGQDVVARRRMIVEARDQAVAVRIIFEICDDLRQEPDGDRRPLDVDALLVGRNLRVDGQEGDAA
jgi:hypothetical protein